MKIGREKKEEGREEERSIRWGRGREGKSNGGKEGQREKRWVGKGCRRDGEGRKGKEKEERWEGRGREENLPSHTELTVWL